MVGHKCTTRTTPRSLDDALDDEEAIECRWEGKPTNTRGRMKHYRAAIVRGVRYQVGEIVTLNVDRVIADGQQSPNVYVAAIEDMWEDTEQEKWMQCRWYYRPEDTLYGRLARHLPGEMFESTHVDDNPLEAIAGKCRMLSLPEYQRYQRRCQTKYSGGDDCNDDGVTTFICRFRYNEQSGEFRPLILDEEKKNQVIFIASYSSLHLSSLISHLLPLYF